MTHSASSRCKLACASGFLLSLVMGVVARAEEPAIPKREARFVLETVTGRVVFLGEAMQRLHGVKWVDEARERTLALETPAGTLQPLVEDVRGRGFRNDRRLRELDLELVVRRYRGSPALQVLGVYSLEKSGKFELDYWCDVCAIAMYELKPCECCQGSTEFRRRKAADLKP